MLLCLVVWLGYVNPYMLYVLPEVMFITSGKRTRIMILLYRVILTYDMTSLGMRLGLYLYAALQSFLYWGCHLSEFINNQTHSMWKTRGGIFPHSFTPLFFFKLVIKAFENFEYPWDVQTSMLLMFCLLNGFQVLFRVKKLSKNITQRTAPGLDSYEWQVVWESMGKYLGQWAPLVFLNLTPEQVQNPDKLVKYVEEYAVTLAILETNKSLHCAGA